PLFRSYSGTWLITVLPLSATYEPPGPAVVTAQVPDSLWRLRPGDLHKHHKDNVCDVIHIECRIPGNRCRQPALISVKSESYTKEPLSCLSQPRWPLSPGRTKRQLRRTCWPHGRAITRHS